MTVGEDDMPQLYQPLAQITNDRRRLQFVLRSRTSPASQVAAVRSTLRRLEPSAGTQVEPLYSSIGLAFLPSQVGAMLFGAIGLLTLVLAAIGLYGMMAYSVARQTQEIGIRMAIGATRSDISRMVLREAVTLVAAGSVHRSGNRAVRDAATRHVPGGKSDACRSVEPGRRRRRSDPHRAGGIVGSGLSCRSRRSRDDAEVRLTPAFPPLRAAARLFSPCSLPRAAGP